MNRIFTRLGLTATAIVAGAGTMAFAQTSTTGAVNGVISTKTGAPVAGATVRLISSQTQRTIITGADGSFRLGLLNPGAWTIEVSKAGLQKFTQHINVLLNQSLPLTIKMADEASSVVEVVSAATTLDTTTTQTGSTYQVDALSAIPKGRDFNGLVFLAPGTQNSSLGASISGASGIENNFVVDGLDTTDYRKGYQGTTMPTDFFDQVEIQTGGFKPEYSALGGVVNAITKSGSNDFMGSAWVTSDLAQLQGKREGNTYYKEASPRNRYDIGFTAGGAFIPDKLFYFVGVNKIDLKDASADANLFPGVTNSLATDKTTNIYGKLNYFITQNQQLTVTVNSVDEPVVADHVYPVSYGNRDFGLSTTNKSLDWSANYDWTISPSLFLSVKYGSTDTKTTNTPTVAAPSISDQMWFNTGPGAGTPGISTTSYYYHGGIGDWTALDKASSNQIRADLSWFVGNHNMKFGISRLSTKSTFIDNLASDDRVSIVQETRASHAANLGQLRYVAITTYANLGSSATVDYNALYAQDQWEVMPGFRLAYGARLETQEVKGNDGKIFVKFTDTGDQIQPRIGFTWDVNNDGKTKVAASYSIYQERVPMQPALRTAGNETYIQKVYYGYATGNASYNTATGGYTVGATPDAVADYSGYFRDDPQPLDGLKVPKRAEYTLGVDRTLENGWTVGVHAKYREMLRIVEDTVPTDMAGNPIDGEGYSILWNPEYGKTYQWRNNKYHSNPGGLNTWTNTEFPDPKNIYQSADVTMDKKTSKYVVSFSYTLSRNFGNYEGLGQTSNGQADGNITSTWDYYPYVGTGPLPLDRTHQFKAFGSYNFDLGGDILSIGGKALYISGAPKSYFDNTNDLGGYGNATPENGQYGTRGTLPAQFTADMHIEYSHKFSKNVKLTPSFDVFNVFNKRTETNWDQYGTTRTGAPNPSFAYTTSWLAGRSYRWGAKLQF